MYKPALNSIMNYIRLFLVIAVSIIVASCTSDKPVRQDKAEIAILMPLTGPYGEQGKKLAELIKWGLEDDLKGFVSTTTYDVATDDFLNQARVKMAQKHTQVILGPLFTPSVKSLESFVKDQDIVMLTLSNNPSIAEDNRILVFGHSPLKQTNRMFGYLFEKNYKEFAFLLPASKSSINLNKVLSEIVASNEGTVLTSEQYVNTPESIDVSVQKISNAVDNAIENVDNEIKPVVMIVEENSEILRELFKALKKYNLDSKAVIVGDSRIDIEFAEGINYLYTGANSIANQQLLARARNDLGLTRLNYLENLAYDLGAFTSTAIGVSYSQETFFNRLKAPIWFKGLSGDLRFNGPILERKYSILERSGNNYKIIDTLPVSEHND